MRHRITLQCFSYYDYENYYLLAETTMAARRLCAKSIRFILAALCAGSWRRLSLVYAAYSVYEGTSSIRIYIHYTYTYIITRTNGSSRLWCFRNAYTLIKKFTTRDFPFIIANFWGVLFLLLLLFPIPQPSKHLLSDFGFMRAHV